VVENLITLGVMPVGVADVKGYTTWVTAAKLDASVKDVGTRGESSVDAIVALNPDLVITTTDESANTIAQLEKAAPVLVVRGADAKNAIPQMKKNLELVGAAIGKAKEAGEANAAFDQAVAEGKKKIADAGRAGEGFTMADGYKQGSTISIRMFTKGSLLGAVAGELGLKNNWTGEGDPDYGLAQTDVEGLTKLGEGSFLYIASTSDGGDVFGGDLAKNAIWKNLPFVKSGSVHRLPDGIWMFGGPKSTEQFIDATVQAVTS
jgi:iron complex transport system substrate-binding protein